MEQSLTRDEFETLTICRNRARDVMRMERKVNAFLPTANGYYKSPQWTGMPGGRDVHGLDGSARKNEAEHRALERAREELAEMKESAMRIICRLDWKMQDFCVAYFVNGEDIDSVAESIGRDRTTCWRKLQRLRGGDGNGCFRRRMSEKRNKMQQNAI
jgi:hypothetical protein